MHHQKFFLLAKRKKEHIGNDLPTENIKMLHLGKKAQLRSIKKN